VVSNEFRYCLVESKQVETEGVQVVQRLVVLQVGSAEQSQSE
jgi:hypothetical protein